MSPQQEFLALGLCTEPTQRHYRCNSRPFNHLHRAVRFHQISCTSFLYFHLDCERDLCNSELAATPPRTTNDFSKMAQHHALRLRKISTTYCETSGGLFETPIHFRFHSLILLYCPTVQQSRKIISPRLLAPKIVSLLLVRRYDVCCDRDESEEQKGLGGVNDQVFDTGIRHNRR